MEDNEFWCISRSKVPFGPTVVDEPCPMRGQIDPTAHSDLVAGSSPAGPTNEINILLDAGCPRRGHRTRNRARYVLISFVRRFAQHNHLTAWLTKSASQGASIARQIGYRSSRWCA